MIRPSVLPAVLLAWCALAFAGVLGEEKQTDTAALGQSAQRTPFLEDGLDDSFRWSFAEKAKLTDNAAVRQLVITRAQHPFLSTMKQGYAQFLTALKPCGVLLPHLHLRADELYTVIFGDMVCGISQENGAAQDLVFDAGPGETCLMPQGVLHYNWNPNCEPLFFIQSFNYNDPGAINIRNAITALEGAGEEGKRGIAASGLEGIEPSSLGSFDLDKACLKRCGLPEDGAPGDGLEGLPDVLRVLYGLEDGNGGYGN